VLLGFGRSGLVRPDAARRALANGPRATIAFVFFLAVLTAGCSSRPYGDLIVGTSAPGASKVDILVATTRAPVVEPPGVMFGGARGRGLDFADIVVSIPPETARRPGDVQWPSSAPGDPQRDFVTLRADRLDLAQAKAQFNSRLARTPGRRVLIFVHGYNTRFEEAVYRFAQIVHDARVDVAPVLFTWPSGGNVIDYVYDRDSAMFSRDALETVLQALAADPNVGSISILAHSMGNYVAIEALRQMSIRNHGLPPKIRDVMLASPDIDVDVFRRQIAQIDAAHETTQFTLFVSRDDRALGLSSFLARDTTRLGALDPSKEPYSSMLEQARVHVIDLTDVASNDVANHSKFATGEVVSAIGERFASGQTLTDAKPGVADSLGTLTRGAIGVAADVAAGAVTAPARIVDPASKEKSVDTAAQSVTLDH
jgi:esterase/lipase superfamily enzyme